jgi:hypothetical protein
MTEAILPTPVQLRLVNIGMFIQFHLAAIGHVVVWLWMLHSFQNPKIPDGWTYEEWYREGGFIIEIFVYQGIPFSFGILVAVYCFFRGLLIHANFGTALVIMIVFNVLHATLFGLAAVGLGAPLFLIVPARLAIPIVLYAIACYLYHRPRLQ